MRFRKFIVHSAYSPQSHRDAEFRIAREMPRRSNLIHFRILRRRQSAALNQLCVSATLRLMSLRVVAAVRNEFCHTFLEHRQRHRAEGENRVVEFTLVERSAQLGFRFLAVPPDLQLA